MLRATVSHVRRGVLSGHGVLLWRRAASGQAPQKLHIAYGSQSGTAMTLAAIMTKEAKAQGLKARLSDLETVRVSDLKPDETLVLLMATYGEGEPTDNAADFYHELLSSDTNELPRPLHYAVFGLGNSATYPERFNVVSKAVDSRFRALRASPVLPLTLGDSASTTSRCVDDDFDDWKEELWTKLREGPSSDTSASSDNAANEAQPLGLQLKEYTSAEQKGWLSQHARLPAPSPAVDYKTPARLRMLVNRELHSKASPRSCKHIELDLVTATYDCDIGRAASMSYTTGDHLGVQPHNRAETVDFFLDNMGYDGDKIVAVGSDSGPQHANLVAPQSVREILTKRRDLAAPVPRASMAALSRYATSAAEARTLRGLGAPGQNEHYQDVIVDNYTGIAELTSLFPSLMGNVPLGVMLELLQPMQGRFYSISSSSTEQPDTVALTVTVVRNQLSSGRVVRGLCSNYLASLEERLATSQVTAFVRQSTLRLPDSPSTPIIMVGAGAGMAPLRAFVREREALIAAGSDAKPGEALLFFGCEHPSWDYLYQDELESSLGTGALTGLHPAFAREPNAEGSRYAQHLLVEEGETVLRMLNEGAPIYVCGKGSTVGVGVRDALQAVLQRYADLSPEASYKAVGEMIEKQQLQQDVFA